MYFGERLLYLRRLKNYTQDYVAKYIGVAKSTYCGYEINNREPNIEKINLLSKLYNVTTNFILGIGVFVDWDNIQNHKNSIINTISKYFKNTFLDKMDLHDDFVFINIIDVLIERIDIINDDIVLYPKTLAEKLAEGNKYTASIESDDEDTNKQRLLNNYELLNEDGQEDLLDYSEMLAGNPRKIKEGDKTVQMNA